MSTKTQILNGRYRILTEIGKGGSAQVYLAEDTTTPLTKKLAIKAISKHGNSQLLNQYRGEMRILDKLAHQNITTILDYFETSSHVYIVMNYIQGNSLKQILQVNGPQDESDVISWGCTLCDVLDYLHEQSIAYCDMNPKNIMIDESNNLHLLDFGICTPITGKRSTLPPMGTPGYSAPEQYEKGSRIIDERTDVYSLGITLLELVSDSKKLNEAQEITPGLKAVLTKATNPDPEKRYQNMGEMKEDLQSVERLQGDNVKRLKRYVAYVAFLALATVLVGFAGWVAWSKTSSTSDTLYAQYLSQGATYEQSGDQDKALDYYLKAAEIKPHNSEAYKNIFNLLVPGENSLNYENQAKSALDSLRYASDASDLDDDTLVSALALASTLSEPVYQNYASNLLQEAKKRKLSSPLIDVWSAALNENTNSAELAEKLFNDESADPTDRLDALFSTDSSFVPRITDFEELIEKADYSRTLPLQTLLASRAWSNYQSSGKSGDLDKAYVYIRRSDNVYSSEERLLRAQIDTAKGDYSDAKKIYNEILSDDPDNTGAMLGLIQTVSAEQDTKETKDYSEAMDAYNKLKSATNLSSEAISQLNAFKLKAGI